MLSVLLTEAGAACAPPPPRRRRSRCWLDRPDVLVSDLAMPDEDGYSLIRNLRTIERASGRQTRRWRSPPMWRAGRARAVAAGFDVFVESRSTPEELLSVLGGLVDSRTGRSTRAGRPDGLGR